MGSWRLSLSLSGLFYSVLGLITVLLLLVITLAWGRRSTSTGPSGRLLRREKRTSGNGGKVLELYLGLEGLVGLYGTLVLKILGFPFGGLAVMGATSLMLGAGACTFFPFVLYVLPGSEI